MKPTKKNLNEIIKWTRSKYSIKRKKEVVDDIYNKIKSGKKGKWNYETSIATSQSLPLLVIKYSLIINKEKEIQIEWYRRGSSWDNNVKTIKIK